MIANFSKTLVKLIKDKCVATPEDHHETLTETYISHGEMLGIVESDNKYSKRDNNDKDINLIKKHCRTPERQP